MVQMPLVAHGPLTNGTPQVASHTRILRILSDRLGGDFVKLSAWIRLSLVAGVLVGQFGTASAQAPAESKLLSCKVLSRASLLDDGKLGDGSELLFYRSSTGFTVDTSSLILRWADGDSLPEWKSSIQFRRWMNETEGNDSVFTSVEVGRGGPVWLATLRIRHWLAGSPFMLTIDEAVFTGRCRSVSAD